MSLGEVDTLNLTFDKLQTLFDESQGYYESFLDANNLYKTGKLSDKEFFQKLGDYVVAYSALEFLSVKVIMEMKKTLDKIAAGTSAGGTHSPGLMPGMGTAGVGMQPDHVLEQHKILLAAQHLLSLLEAALVKREHYQLQIHH